MFILANVNITAAVSIYSRSVLQDSDDSELKGACGFTPHPYLKVCL